jgi:hypothetical protein
MEVVHFAHAASRSVKVKNGSCLPECIGRSFLRSYASAVNTNINVTCFTSSLVLAFDP